MVEIALKYSPLQPDPGYVDVVMVMFFHLHDIGNVN